MQPPRRLPWLVLVALVVFSALVSPGCGPSTQLIVVMFGGFAYVPTPAERKLEVAYLNDTDVDGCKVDQLGTKLFVEEGTITEPATPPADRMFDLDGAIVTFPALEMAGHGLNAQRGQRPNGPFRPGNPQNESHWRDLRFVPSLVPEHAGAAIDPNWRESVGPSGQREVNGRMVLRGGRLRGFVPSSEGAKVATFDFKENGTTSKFIQAITDQTTYDVKVPGVEIVIDLANATKAGTSRIVVKPIAEGRPVRLKLIGAHPPGTPPVLNTGDTIKDYCAFYQLLKDPPAKEKWLIPTYVAPPPPPVKPGETAPGQPSPGFFCPGDWF